MIRKSAGVALLLVVGFISPGWGQTLTISSPGTYHVVASEAEALDRSVVTWDWNDCDDIGRKVYAKADAHVRKGGYRINFTWLRVELYLSDEKDFEGMDRARAMLRRLARPKLGGALEFPGGVVSE